MQRWPKDDSATWVHACFCMFHEKTQPKGILNTYAMFSKSRMTGIDSCCGFGLCPLLFRDRGIPKKPIATQTRGQLSNWTMMGIRWCSSVWFRAQTRDVSPPHSVVRALWTSKLPSRVADQCRHFSVKWAIHSEPNAHGSIKKLWTYCVSGCELPHLQLGDHICRPRGYLDEVHFLCAQAAR